MPYISAFYANLIFIIYIELTLNKKGRKLVAGIDIYDLESLPHKALQTVLEEALMLDRSSVNR